MPTTTPSTQPLWSPSSPIGQTIESAQHVVEDMRLTAGDLEYMLEMVTDAAGTVHALADDEDSPLADALARTQSAQRTIIELQVHYVHDMKIMEGIAHV